MTVYKVTVPISVRNTARAGGKEKILTELLRIGADRVILALGALSLDKSEKQAELALLCEYTSYFKSKGLKVASWMWTFMTDGVHPYHAIESADGTRLNNFACPLDNNFLEFAKQYVKDVARSGVDVVMFDDDFRFGYMGGKFNCTCPLHMKKIKTLIGEDITPRELQKKALSGGKNKYRDAWLKVNGEALLNHARAMRAAVDEVDPDIRIGVCSCISVWDADGIDSITLAKALAGSTKPYMRLIGAPYWAVRQSFGCRLSHVIELERMERAWCGDGIEIYAEGDAYPRPRTNCPASFLELYDIALRASGGFDGIQKYALDYTSTADYETGYTDRHVKNKPVYDFVAANFDRPSVGVRVYEKMQKLADMYIPPEYADDPDIFDIFFSASAKMMADNSVATTYEGEGVCGIAFGENVREVPREAFKNGLIIDIRAAKILMDMGIDVGIDRLGERILVNEEHYDSEYIGFAKPVYAFDTKLKAAAVIKSEFAVNTTKMTKRMLPALFEYTNGDGDRFLVYTFDSYMKGDTAYRSYIRTRQINAFARLPVYTEKHPDLYIIAKRDAGGMAVGLFNIFADEVIAPTLTLDKEYTTAECVNCHATLCGNTLTFSDIPAFTFAGVVLK